MAIVAANPSVSTHLLFDFAGAGHANLYIQTSNKWLPVTPVPLDSNQVAQITLSSASCSALDILGRNILENALSYWIPKIERPLMSISVLAPMVQLRRLEKRS